VRPPPDLGQTGAAAASRSSARPACIHTAAPRVAAPVDRSVPVCWPPGAGTGVSSSGASATDSWFVGVELPQLLERQDADSMWAVIARARPRNSRGASMATRDLVVLPSAAHRGGKRAGDLAGVCAARTPEPAACDQRVAARVHDCLRNSMSALDRRAPSRTRLGSGSERVAWQEVIVGRGSPPSAAAIEDGRTS
jgi:hypothetical protein